MNKFILRAGSDDAAHADAANKTGFWGAKGAGALILCPSTNRMLLGLRSSDVDEPLTWAGFGGAVDLEEHSSAAVLREVFEETGYSDSMHLFPLCAFRAPGFTYYNYLGLVPKEFQLKLSAETSRAGWFSWKEFPSPLHPGMRYCLNHPTTKRKLHFLGFYV